MPGWLALTCGSCAFLAAGYLLFVIFRPEDF